MKKHIDSFLCECKKCKVAQQKAIDDSVKDYIEYNDKLRRKKNERD